MDKTFKFRLSGDLDEKYGRSVEALGDPEADRSKIARRLIRWWVRETDELPKRPDPEDN